MSSAVSHRSPSPSSSLLMLPYGYQIDLDFIKYCENLTQPNPSDAELQRRQRRRQRQSMEVMLGIQMQMQNQMDQLYDIWERKPPEPPPRTHHHHRIESPIVPFYMKQQKRQPNMSHWDPSLNDVVDDFEKTLERSNSKREKVRRSVQAGNVKGHSSSVETGDCIPVKHSSKSRVDEYAPTPVHASVESVDGAQLDLRRDSEDLKRKIRDLEEQTKLIPLLQLQIQSLRDERVQLQSQLEGRRASSASSSSPHPQPVFQAQRVSPVSLNAIKLAAPAPPKRANRSTGTNTPYLLHRDAGCSPDVVTSTVNRGTSTDFFLKFEGDGGRLYTERDLKKAIEMAHAKMRKSTATVGVQVEQAEEKPKVRSVGCDAVTVSTSNASCGTEKQHLMKTTIAGITIVPEEKHLMRTTVAGITIAPEEQNLMTTTIKGITIAPAKQPELEAKPEVPSATSLSLRDMNKLPVTRTSATQTFGVLTHQQGTQSSPIVISKATDSNDLIRLVHKTSMTEVSQKRDQIVHTGDLIKVSQAGTNTPQQVLPLTRSTASNTSAVNVNSVGINCETSPLDFTQNHQGNSLMVNSSSKIPRPSPMAQRKFVRQETFTVSTDAGSQNVVKECPAEALWKLTMTQPRHHSPVPALESPSHTNFATPTKEPLPEPASESPMRRSPSPEPEELSPVNEEPPVGPSKMVMSPSIEYLDDDEYDEEEDDDDKFNDELVAPSTIPLRPPPTSISTIRLSQQNRVKIRPSKEMVAALKVINDHLQKSPDALEDEIRTAREVASCEWFKISSTEAATSDNVEDYLDFYEEQSWDLLTYMVNLSDKNGNTAMHYAVSHGNFDVVSILLDSKVTSINQTNNAGYTCVMLVSLAKLLVEEHKTVVRRLFKLADVNIRATKNSQTALMLAVSHGNTTIASMLVEAAADINIQDDDGSTALMCAAEHGHLDIVKFLLAQPDCDSTKLDVDGNTALKISLEAGYHDIGCLLYAHEHLLRNKTSLKRTPSSMKSSTSSLN